MNLKFNMGAKLQIISLFCTFVPSKLITDKDDRVESRGT